MQAALSAMNVLPQQRVFNNTKAAQKPASRSMRFVVRAEAAEAAAPKAASAPFTPPTLDPNTPSPIFGGSTGAWKA